MLVFGDESQAVFTELLKNRVHMHAAVYMLSWTEKKSFWKGAQRRTVIVAEFVRLESARFKFTTSRLISLPIRRFRCGFSSFAVLPAIHQKSPPTNRWGW